ncbi:hypothetical protein LTR95_015180 [Oleoguttula sp. CCFEE 5521]
MSGRPALESWVLDQTNATPFAATAHRLAPGAEEAPRYCPPVPRDVESMARMFDGRTAMRCSDKGSVPSLDLRSRTLSGSYIETLEAESAVQAGGLDEDGQVIEYELASAQTPVGIKCLFNFLGCDQVWESMTRWNDHSKSHLEGHTPPTELECPVRHCAESFQAESGETAWTDWWEHIQTSHNFNEMADLSSSLDMGLVQYLYRESLISRADMQELRIHGRLGMETRSVVSSQSESRHRRREGGQPRSGRARR